MKILGPDQRHSSFSWPSTKCCSTRSEVEGHKYTTQTKIIKYLKVGKFSGLDITSTIANSSSAII